MGVSYWRREWDLNPHKCYLDYALAGRYITILSPLLVKLIMTNCIRGIMMSFRLRCEDLVGRPSTTITAAGVPHFTLTTRFCHYDSLSL